MQPFQSQANLQYGLAHCPDDAASIISDCGDSVPCLYNYALLQSKVLAFEEQDTWNSFITERVDAVRQYNSCGAINIEYPEYMMKTPALASGYLQGDVARFDCYQSHWIKGDHEYKCGIVVDYNNPNSYRFEWNKGSQPWCRSRVKENYFKWITVIFSTVAIILALMVVFLFCWCVKQRKIQEQRQYNYRDTAEQNGLYKFFLFIGLYEQRTSAIGGFPG
ncbi:unnamed protein product [Strongylus vulgaris]|uniref:Sushi domain-containing protein n=1 Tax=Strongylus vulgaris TaxID=40348 RepID=A0A3P7ILR8_STRVU|nr:unnamed protein product [Strongylus vulgaris]